MRERLATDKIIDIVWLRLQNMSYNKISEQLKISKPIVFRKIKKYALSNEEKQSIVNRQQLYNILINKIIPYVDLKDKKYNCLTPKYKIIDKHNIWSWFCECDCGKTTIVRQDYLLNNRIKSCGCLRSLNTSKRKSKNPIGVNENAVYFQYLHSAKKRNLLFELSKEQCIKLFNSECFYCGLKPYTKKAVHRNKLNLIERNIYYYYNGIDRKDNNIGYTLDNCVSCCKFCNKGKSVYSESDFINWIESVKASAIKTFIQTGGYENGVTIQKCNPESKTNCSNTTNPRTGN